MYRPHIGTAQDTLLAYQPSNHPAGALTASPSPKFFRVALPQGRCATWHTPMSRQRRGTACGARCPPPEARPVPGNTKGGCPFVPERQSGPPCNPPTAAPDALRSVGRARRLARARGQILALPPHPVPRRKGRAGCCCDRLSASKERKKSWDGSPTTGPISIRKSPTR